MVPVLEENSLVIGDRYKQMVTYVLMSAINSMERILLEDPGILRS